MWRTYLATPRLPAGVRRAGVDENTNIRWTRVTLSTRTTNARRRTRSWPVTTSELFRSGRRRLARLFRAKRIIRDKSLDSRKCDSSAPIFLDSEQSEGPIGSTMMGVYYYLFFLSFCQYSRRVPVKVIRPLWQDACFRFGKFKLFVDTFVRKISKLKKLLKKVNNKANFRIWRNQKFCLTTRDLYVK